MSAAANVKAIATEKTQAVKPGQTFIFGKIQSVEKFQTKSRETRYRTRVLMKAADEFGYPMPFDVVSTSPLGSQGDIWEGVGEARTYRKDYTTRPDEHGEVKKIAQITCEWYLAD